MSAKKRAISLPSDLDDAVYHAAKRAGRSYSGLVCEALAVYLDLREKQRLEQTYREYYGVPRPDEEALAREFFALSQEAWPD